MASSMARDFIHSEEIGDAIVAILEANLPATWLEAGHPDELRVLAFGDMHEYVARGASIRDECPAILVKPLGVTPFSVQGFGGMASVESFRIIMVRTFAQTTDSDGSLIAAARGRARYAKILNTALFHSERLGNPALSTVDQAAAIRRIRFVGWDYDAGNGDTAAIMELSADVWAISVDIGVEVITGPRSDDGG